ncbi:MAG: histidine phosphatase family protein, partial [Pseudomonadota bacterium]
TLAGLDEYPADEIMRDLAPVLRRTHPQIDQDALAFENAADKTERYRTVHRLLESVMRAWVHEEYDKEAVDLPTWAEFSGGVRAALRSIMSDAPGSSDVAVFTSGGPVGIAVQTILEAPEVKAAELNWRVHNASVTRFTFSSNRISLDTFNDVSHLPSQMLTYR